MKPIHLAFVGALAGASVLSAPPAIAGDNTWACEVALCISNPGGPTQYSACVPPITKLWRHLAFGGGFPACTGAGIRDTDYDKADDGRPAKLTIQWADGRRQTFYQGRTSTRPTPTLPGWPRERLPRNVDLR